MHSAAAKWRISTGAGILVAGLLAGCGKESPAPPSPPASAGATQAVAAANSPTAAAPAVDARSPEDVEFQKRFDEVLALEREGDFSAAITLCRKLKNEFKSPRHAGALQAAAARIREVRRASTDLPFAVKKLGSDDEADVAGARAVFRAAGDPGLIFLRKAYREGKEPAASRAAELMIELQDPGLGGLLIDSLKAAPDIPLDPALAKLLAASATSIAPGSLVDLCRLAPAAGTNQPLVINVIMSALEHAIDDSWDASEPDLLPTLFWLGKASTGKLQRDLLGALVYFYDRDFKPDRKAFSRAVGDKAAFAFIVDTVGNYLEHRRREIRFWARKTAKPLDFFVPGMRGKVYRGRNWGNNFSEEAFVYERLDASLNFPTRADFDRNGQPVKGPYAVRWLGFLHVPTDGKYKFFVEHSPKSPGRLSIGGRGVGTLFSKDQDVELKAGLHDLQLELAYSFGDFKLQVYWEGPDIERQIIGRESFLTAPLTR